MNQTLKKKLIPLPDRPGVYLYRNAKGEVIYVGKAKNLRARVRSYFSSSHDLQPKTKNLVGQIADLEYIVTDTEVEALMLENILIKKHLPRYNVMLRDDKNFLFIKIDYSTEIPQITTARKIEGASTVRPLPALPLPGEEGKEMEIPQITTARKIEDAAVVRPPVLRQGYGGHSSLSLPSRLRQGYGGQASGAIIEKALKNLKTTNHKLPTNKYFGPYTSGQAVRETLRLARQIFPYCAHKKVGPRPCFYYHLGRCPGVCIGAIALAEYEQTLRRIAQFLRGELESTLKQLRSEMQAAAKNREFEKAAKLRDQSAALARMIEKQKVVSPKPESYDAVGLARLGERTSATVMQVRLGKLMGRLNFLLDNGASAADAELLETFLSGYYSKASDMPRKIILDRSVGELEVAGYLAAGLYGKKVIVSSPRHGHKREMALLAARNAEEYLIAQGENLKREHALATRALFDLKSRLELAALPLRIECYDISNTQGTNPTGSMVVFENGAAKKSEYKRFAIKSIETPDDFAMMREMLERRFARVSTSPFPSPGLGSLPAGRQGWPTRLASPSSARREAGAVESWRLPDLIVIDGGIGQLNVALKILRAAERSGVPAIPAIGLAKRKEEIYLPDNPRPLRLHENSPGLQLLQRLRDEAHRFAITYHRKRRSKSMLAG